MGKRIVSFALLATAGLASALGAEAPPPLDMTGVPGFVDAGELDLYDRPENIAVEVNLEGPLVRFMAELVKGGDPELSEALGKIRSFRFRLFQPKPDEVADIRRRITRATQRLEKRRWQRVLVVADEGNKSYLYIKTEGESIIGLVVLFLDDEDQFGFINLAGEIDPAQIGRIGQHYDIDVLEDAVDELEKSTPPREERE